MACVPIAGSIRTMRTVSLEVLLDLIPHPQADALIAAVRLKIAIVEVTRSGGGPRGNKIGNTDQRKLNERQSAMPIYNF